MFDHLNPRNQHNNYRKYNDNDDDHSKPFSAIAIVLNPKCVYGVYKESIYLHIQ